MNARLKVLSNTTIVIKSFQVVSHGVLSSLSGDLPFQQTSTIQKPDEAKQLNRFTTVKVAYSNPSHTAETLFQFRSRIHIGFRSCDLAFYDGANQLDDNFSPSVDVLDILVDWFGSRCGHMQECNLSPHLGLVAICQTVEIGEVAKEVAWIVGNLQGKIQVLAEAGC